MRKLAGWLAVSTILGVTSLSGTASADVISLNFEGVTANYPYGAAQVLGFYNGGTSSDGTSGINYGIEFTDNAYAFCLNTPGVSCSNTSRGGIGDPASQHSALVFSSGSETFMNVAAGFETGFSFNYSAPFFGGSVSVYDGLNGTGTQLAMINLALTPNGACDSSYSGGANYCPFVGVGVSFSGTAKSVSFGGVADYIVFDDITFGSVTPGNPVPVPAALPLLLSGLAGLGVMARRKAA